MLKIPKEILVFWDITPSRLVFLKVEAKIFSETSATVYIPTRHHISEDFNHLHSYDNLTSRAG
jgi:hypothetical protein